LMLSVLRSHANPKLIPPWSSNSKFIQIENISLSQCSIQFFFSLLLSLHWCVALWIQCGLTLNRVNLNVLPRKLRVMPWPSVITPSLIRLKVIHFLILTR
jgi:hypothetical protein